MGMISYVKQEIEVIRERDPAIKSNMEVFLYPSFKVILSYRVAHKLYLKKHYFWARWISQRAARKTGIEIHPGATIGKGLFIDHGTGVIIGETTIIGDNVTLYQGVTLGGTGKEQGKRHPTLKDNVMVIYFYIYHFYILFLQKKMLHQARFVSVHKQIGNHKDNRLLLPPASGR